MPHRSISLHWYRAGYVRGWETSSSSSDDDSFADIPDDEYRNENEEDRITFIRVVLLILGIAIYHILYHHHH